MDKLSEEELKDAVRRLKDAGIPRVMFMSALKGEGVDDVIYEALKTLGIRLEEIFSEGKEILKKVLSSTPKE